MLTHDTVIWQYVSCVVDAATARIPGRSDLPARWGVQNCSPEIRKRGRSPSSACGSETVI
jgi:hypothetical protein